jgi:2'-5' RNA ligase
MPPSSANTDRARLRHIYDRLWLASIGSIRAGEIEPDPVLAAGLPDPRRGLTLIGRPSPAVRRRVETFLRELRQFEPEQYYYASSEFHLTVLPLFTATARPDPFFARTKRYVAAVDSIMRRAAPIHLEFAGVTVSSDAVLIQGFFENQALNELRDALRRQIRSDWLAESLDGRYRLETAHMTVVRFRARLRDAERFAGALDEARHRVFGETDVRSLRLVKNDWYMTRSVLETVKRYRLCSIPATRDTRPRPASPRDVEARAKNLWQLSSRPATKDVPAGNDALMRSALRRR